MGKEVVVIKESARLHHQPHQRVNRQRGLLYAAGGNCLSGGYRQSAETRPLNHPMGPIRTCRSRRTRYPAEIFLSIFTNRWEKNIAPRRLLVQYVKAGRLGRKSGRGVF